jgi:hypothetical protein
MEHDINIDTQYIKFLEDELWRLTVKLAESEIRQTINAFGGLN